MAATLRPRTVPIVQHANFDLEQELWQRHEWVVGLDEVGRGPYAGPLVIGACALRREHAATAPHVADSKLLTPTKREELSAVVSAWADVALGSVSAREIDEIGMAAALRLACERALSGLPERVAPLTCVVQDGSASWLPDSLPADVERIIRPKLDVTSAACAAASIVAKVHRDAVMRELGARYPQWPALSASAGYGTKAHEAQILEHGLCPEHRFSWSFAQRLAPGAQRPRN